jgi:ABC-type nitrate/sulfonate/bicarbonate transport system permease component
VFTTVVIPTYHGVRDLAPVYVVAARLPGVLGALPWFRVVSPAVTPAGLSAPRYSLTFLLAHFWRAQPAEPASLTRARGQA